MAEKTVIATEIKVETGNSAKTVGDLKKELQDIGTSGKDAGIKGSAGMGKLSESLSEVSPVAKRATEGFQGFNTVLNVIRANPIIAVITALVGVLIAVGKYMSGVDGAADAMSRSWASLSTLLSAFMDKVLSPLIDGFVWLIDGLTKLGTLIGDTFSPGLKAAADRAGELRDQLNDLEDAQKNNAIATEEAKLKLAEARDMAADSTLTIKQRVAALKEAAKIEKEQADEVYKTNLAIYRNRVEQMGIEMNVRKELLDTIRNGSIEQLKAARVELLAMKNVNGDKLLELDRYLTEAINSQAASSKIQTKTEKQITAMEKEEESKRAAQRKEAADKNKAEQDKRNAEKLEQEKKFQEDYKKMVLDGQKALDDAKKVLYGNTRQFELDELRKKYDADISAAQKAGYGLRQITDAFRKQQDDINFKYDKEQKEKTAAKQKIKDDAEKIKRDAVLQRVIDANMAIIKAKEDAAKAKIAIDENLLKQQIAMQAETSDLLGKASEIFGKQTAVGKGLAIAQALINTYSGATDALRAKSALPSPFDVAAKVINVGAVLATGFKAVKAITAVQVPGGGGAGGSAPSISAPVLPQAATTTLNQGQINQIGNTAARAFVLETDVSGNQERIRRLNRAARIN